MDVDVRSMNFEDGLRILLRVIRILRFVTCDPRQSPSQMMVEKG